MPVSVRDAPVTVLCAWGCGMLPHRMLIYDALDARCRVVKLRGKIADCAVCSDDPSITCIEDRWGPGGGGAHNSHSLRRDVHTLARATLAVLASCRTPASMPRTKPTLRRGLRL